MEGGRAARLHALTLRAALTVGMTCVGVACAVFALPISRADGEPPRELETTTRAEQSTQVTVTGTLQAAGRDAAGRATAVQITDANGGRFLIAQVGKGKELLAHVGKSATVTGRLLSEAERVLEVESFRLRQG